MFWGSVKSVRSSQPRWSSLGTVVEVVALEGHLALEAVAALLGRDVHHARHGLAVLGVEAAGEHLDLVDDRGVDLVAVAAAREGVVHRHAVDDELGVVGPAAADVDLVVLQGHAGLVGDHVHQLVEGHGLDLLAGQVVAGAGLLDLDELARGLDGDGLGVDLLDVELELEVHHAARLQAHGLRLDAIADVAGLDRVGAGPQAAQEEVAVGERHGADVRAGDEDVGVGHGLAGLGVEHLTLDDAGAGDLGSPWRGERQGEQGRDQQRGTKEAATHGASTPRS